MNNIQRIRKEQSRERINHFLMNFVYGAKHVLFASICAGIVIVGMWFIAVGLHSALEK